MVAVFHEESQCSVRRRSKVQDCRKQIHHVPFEFIFPICLGVQIGHCRYSYSQLLAGLVNSKYTLEELKPRSVWEDYNSLKWIVKEIGYEGVD